MDRPRKPRHRRNPQLFYSDQYAELGEAVRRAEEGGAPQPALCAEPHEVAEKEGVAEDPPATAPKPDGKVRSAKLGALELFRGRMEGTGSGVHGAGASVGSDGTLSTEAAAKVAALEAARAERSAASPLLGLRTLFDSQGGTEGSMALVCGAVNDGDYTARGRPYPRCYSFMARQAAGGDEPAAELPAHRRPLELEDTMDGITARLNREMYSVVAPEVLLSMRSISHSPDKRS